MGLDMFLNRKLYIGGQYEHRNVSGTVEICIDGEPVNISAKDISEIIQQAGYWRKANSIHKWIVDNVQDGNDDCGEYYFSREKMNNLLGDVNEILADHTQAEKLLPPEDGFFFGSTDVDEWYFADLEHTKEILEKCLSAEYEGSDFYYQSSW